MSLEMHAGNANVVVAEHRDGEMMVSTFSSNLEAVLTLMDRGRLGGGPYGCQEHKDALDAVEAQLAKTRLQIAEQDAADAAMDDLDSECHDCGEDTCVCPR